MKNISKKQIIIATALVVVFALAIAAIFVFKNWSNLSEKTNVEMTNQEKTVETESGSESSDIVDLKDPIIDWQAGEFVFLSGGYESREAVGEKVAGRILVYLAWDSSDPVYYTNDWQLDSFDISSNKQLVVYATFHTQAKIYRVYRYDVINNTNVLLEDFDISNSEIFTDHHIHLPLSSLEISPDAEHYYLNAYSSTHIASLGLAQDNFVQSTNGGDLIDLNIPKDIYQQYWFSNSEVAFSGANFAGSNYDADYVQIYNINNHLVSSTKIPTRGSFSGLSPKVNPASTAYAYYDITENHGYPCGGSIMDLVVLAYPDGKELLRLENLHELEYRWLADGALEIIYTRIPEVTGEYLPRSKTDQETLDSIQCSKEETMYFEVP
jgi:hypothetical protein